MCCTGCSRNPGRNKNLVGILCLFISSSLPEVALCYITYILGHRQACKLVNMLGHQVASKAPLTSRLTGTMIYTALKRSTKSFTAIAVSVVVFREFKPYWLLFIKLLQ